MQEFIYRRENKNDIGQELKYTKHDLCFIFMLGIITT